LMQPRVNKQINYLYDLINRLEKHIQLKLVKEINIDDQDVMSEIVGEVGQSHDVTLSDIASKIEKHQGTKPIDQEWLKRVTQLLAKLKDLRWKYTHGVTGQGRTSMGIINSTGCTSVWGSTFPYNPYPFPWANHLFQDSVSMALGVFEGHMAKMAEGFKAIRMAELEIANQYNPTEHDSFFTYFNWHKFTEDEFQLCPPVVSIGGDGAMYDIGFQNLSRAMMTGMPIKVVVVDTQVYSNTGGQACTSGFVGQISDMAPYGKVNMGKQEIRKEIGLIAMAHRTTYVLQSTIARPNHMIEGFIEGLMTKRPAIFNCYTSCQPEHGIGDDMGRHQAKLAIESRAYPLFRFNPDKGKTAAECFDLDGNPAINQDWPSYKLTYAEGLREKTMDLPMTFADFAVTEVRFRKHFRMAAVDTWNENMLPLAEFLDLALDDREGKFPFIWTVDKQNKLGRLIVDKIMVESCEERRDFWIMLRSIAGVDKPITPAEDLESKLRQEIVSKISAGLMQLVGQDGMAAPVAGVSPIVQSGINQALGQQGVLGDGNYMAPWIDSEECTACDECININPNIFVYDENGKTIIKDPLGGPYRDLVKAAEKCTAQVIHPGLPKDSSEKDMDKWIKRGEKFN